MRFAGLVAGLAFVIGPIACRDNEIAAPTSCPATHPTTGASCAFNGNCNYDDVCTCHGCCSSGFSCTNGTFSYLGYSDGCMQGPSCPDDGGTD